MLTYEERERINLRCGKRGRNLSPVYESHQELPSRVLLLPSRRTSVHTAYTVTRRSLHTLLGRVYNSSFDLHSCLQQDGRKRRENFRDIVYVLFFIYFF